MSGTAKGRIDCYFNGGSATNNVKDTFVGLYKFLLDLETAGYTERIALQYGSGGTGMDYYDGAAPPGTNAFYVFRFKPSGVRTWSWYLLAQCGNGTNFGTAPGDPGLIDGSTNAYTLGLAMAVARTSGGADTSPWTGDTDEDGTDLKGPASGGPGGSSVWAAPVGGSLYVLPRSNGIGGSHYSVKQNCCGFNLYSSTSPVRVHYFADLDNLAIAVDYNDTGTTYAYYHMGIYTPITGLSPTIPMAMMGNNNAFLDHSTQFGLVAGGAPNGGVIQARDNTARIGLRSVRIAEEYGTMQPNNQFASAAYMETDIPVYADETPNSGLLGSLDPFIRQTYNCATLTTLNTKARIALGTATTADGKVTFPWDGTTTPKTTVTRNGVSF